MKISPILFAVILAAPLTAQSRPGDIQLDTSGTTTAFGPAIASSDLVSVAVWNSDDTVMCATSTDGGNTWNAPIAIGGGSGSGAKRTYKDAIAIDADRIYVAYEDEATGSEEHMFTVSGDKGATWSTPVQLTTLKSGDIYDINLVADNGTVVVTSMSDSFPQGCYAHISNDGGATWTASRLDAGTGDIDEIDTCMSGNDILVTWNDDTTGANAVYAAVSNDAGATFGAVTQVSGTGTVRAQDHDCYTENGDMVVAWLQDDTSISGTAEDVVAAYSSDSGATWGAPVNVTTTGLNGGDCDNLEVYHSQLNAGTGGMTNFVFENNPNGSDEVFCVSSDDYLATPGIETNLGAGGFPRVVGERSYVGVAFTGPGFPENPMLAVSRDGGFTFGTGAMDMSDGASTGDADFVEVGYDARYDNFVVVYLEDRLGSNNVWACGTRAAYFDHTISGGTITFNAERFGLQAVPSDVQMVAAFNNNPSGVALPADGRNIMLAFDPILNATRTFSPLRISLSGGGSGATGALTPPSSVSGATLYWVGVEMLSVGGFGSITDPVAITMP